MTKREGVHFEAKTFIVNKWVSLRRFTLVQEKEQWELPKVHMSYVMDSMTVFEW